MSIAKYARIRALEIQKTADHAFSLLVVAALFFTLLVVPHLF